MIIDLFFIVIAYFIGSISCAIVLSKYFKLPDPREHGSKNPGATNVLRTGHKLAAAGVLLGDASKGILAILIARLFGVEAMALSLVAAASVIGHIYPVFFQFKGGKGVATAFGALIALSLPLAIISAIIFGVCLAITRYVSLSSIVCAGVSVVLSLFFGYTLGIFIIAALIIFRHKDNIIRLKNGTETKITFKKDF
jgi:acyl phosphate:glycerol-3-phosphate acyltransferase